MILVILGVCIALIVIGIIVGIKFDDLIEDVATPIVEIGIIGSIITVIALTVLSVFVVNLSVIDDRIAMYEEENVRIEEQIATVVKQYHEYETKIFTNVSSDSAITLVSLYPELKSDSLVSSQIDIYVKNNEKIKELREKKITGNVLRWWLYFG